MKTIKILLIFSLLVIVLVACKKQPVACFTVNNTTWYEDDTLFVFVGDTVTVNAACTGDAGSYEWSSVGLGGYVFGNGSTVVEQYTFTEIGEYNISLTVKNGKKTDAKTLPVVVE
jgi:PKD repeat protein